MSLSKGMYGKMTQKKLKEKTKGIIQEIGLCESIKNEYPHHFDFFVDYLFPRHPRYFEKTKGLTDVMIQYNRTRDLAVFIKKEDGSVDDISALNKCINGKEKDNLQIAMRNSIIPQIKAFRRNNHLRCEICGCENNIEVDHKEPQFIELMSDFVNSQGYKPTSFTTNKCYSKIFKECDLDFKDKWNQYHETHCNLRLLCKKCNASRPKKKKNIILV